MVLNKFKLIPTPFFQYVKPCIFVCFLHIFFRYSKLSLKQEKLRYLLFYSTTLYVNGVLLETLRYPQL